MVKKYYMLILMWLYRNNKIYKQPDDLQTRLTDYNYIEDMDELKCIGED